MTSNEQVSDERLEELAANLERSFRFHKTNFEAETAACLRELQRRRASEPELLTIPDFLRNQENLRAERAAAETPAYRCTSVGGRVMAGGPTILMLSVPPDLTLAIGTQWELRPAQKATVEQGETELARQREELRKGFSDDIDLYERRLARGTMDEDR